MKLFIGVLVSLISFSTLAMPAKPDPKKTPGEMCDQQDPDFAHLRYKEQIAWCERNVSYEQRQAIYDLYGVPQKCRVNYTIDHFIPLSLGGNNSPRNLWPEHKKIKQLRIDLETELHEAMNRATITQEQAVDEIVQAKMNPPKAAYSLTDPCESEEKGKK